MRIVAVTTQRELDTALESDADVIEIRSGRVSLGDSKGKIVEAYDSVSVRASGSVSVRAFGSVSVRAYDSASVRAFDSVSVRASGSVSVEAYDSVSVRASGSASVEAFGSASVRAGRWVAVHLRSARATVTGGVAIDIASLDQSDPTTWCELHGADTDDGRATVYKAVNANLLSGHGTEYPIGQTVVAPDWNGRDSCGGGLHFGPTPAQAADYYNGPGVPRYLACSIPIDAARGITGPGTPKIKARECVVLYEVDRRGRPVAS